MNVIFLGPPGSGKGTMAERVSKRMGLAHISTGDMLRAEIKGQTELGDLAKSYIERGALVPDEVIIDMMKERAKKDDAKRGVLLDGFPRTVKQAEELDAIMEIDACVNLVISVEAIVDRVVSRRVCDQCGAIYSTKTYTDNSCEKCAEGQLMLRQDDNEETVRERYRVYEEQTAPLIDYYSKRGLVTDVDAMLPIEEEAELICSILENKK
ncbi:MAG: adenylate kinase [Christensenellaceae bacterium]|jgi:adenylate kinase